MSPTAARKPWLQLFVRCVGRIERHQVVRPRQATDVGGENPLITSLHGAPPSASSDLDDLSLRANPRSPIRDPREHT